VRVPSSGNSFVLCAPYPTQPYPPARPPRLPAPLQSREQSAALAASQRDALTLRGRCLELQHAAALLGGDLRGRLALAQGAVVAELKQQLGARDAAIAASQERLGTLQSDLERLASALAARAGAERRERERLGAEAAQARLLCAARGRQAAQLQQRVEALQAQAERAQGGWARRGAGCMGLARAGQR
jgi:hypothetical protein